MNNQNIPHTPVLLQEIIQAFSHCKDGYIIDCTAGFGGHSFNILNNNPNIKLIYNDQDIQALNFCENRLKPFENKTIKNFGNFSTVISKYSKLNITGILADIGVSSLQLDDLSRGFSFQSESLDMRMDKNSNLKASDIVNNYPQTKLEKILKEYGEIKEYKKIASLIIQNRPFKSAKELSLLLNKNLYNSGKLNPSTLTFQAIRIEVNSELEVLKELFIQIQNANLKNCIVAIISFHSLEDKIVKNCFKNWAKRCICPPFYEKCKCGNNNNLGKILTKKPIIPTKNEISKNARSRSAKLRIFKFE